MKARKVKEALKMYDQLQTHIDRCDVLINQLTAKPQEPIKCPAHSSVIFNDWARGAVLEISSGGLESELGTYLYFNIGPDIKRLIEDKRKELIKEQDALEI